MSRTTTLLSASALLAAMIATAGVAQAQGTPADEPRGSSWSEHHGDRWGGKHHRGHRGFFAIDFAAIDTDADGTLTRDELRTHAETRLAVFDLDSDGSLNAEELAAMMPESPRAVLMNPFGPDRAARFVAVMLERMDATEAGAVAISDLAERHVNTVLARVDRDRDGSISTEEAERGQMRRDRGYRSNDDGPRRSRD